MKTVLVASLFLLLTTFSFAASDNGFFSEVGQIGAKVARTIPMSYVLNPEKDLVEFHQSLLLNIGEQPFMALVKEKLNTMADDQKFKNFAIVGFRLELGLVSSASFDVVFW